MYKCLFYCSLNTGFFTSYNVLKFTYVLYVYYMFL